MVLVDVVVLTATLVIGWILITWAMKVTAATLRAALVVGIILVMLRVGFGIGPEELLRQAGQLPQLWQEWFPQKR